MYRNFYGNIPLLRRIVDRINEFNNLTKNVPIFTKIRAQSNHQIERKRLAQLSWYSEWKWIENHDIFIRRDNIFQKLLLRYSKRNRIHQNVFNNITTKNQTDFPGRDGSLNSFPNSPFFRPRSFEHVP
jgi:hypothetical protein